MLCEKTEKYLPCLMLYDEQYVIIWSSLETYNGHIPYYKSYICPEQYGDSITKDIIIIYKLDNSNKYSEESFYIHG